MLRVIQNSHAGGAKSYYSTGDYYLDGQELAGVWRGEGAKKLGLTGEIARADWDALCDGINPKTGEKLLQRQQRQPDGGLRLQLPRAEIRLGALRHDQG